MRRLVAIMFTDIKGFTAMMQQDELSAVNLLARHKELFLSFTSQYNGQVIKYMGDGTLTVFDSANQAVRCGIALQRAFNTEPVIPVRIGIHMGEVILENNDVIGDSVNLSSRIQSAGVAGSVFISEKVKDEINNQKDIKVVEMGLFHLKNITLPKRLYAVNDKGLVVPAKDFHYRLPDAITHAHSSKVPQPVKWALSILLALLFLGFLCVKVEQQFFSGKSKKHHAIAVSPFQNVGGNMQDDYLASGMTDDVIKLLGVVPSFYVSKISDKQITGFRESLIQDQETEAEVSTILSGTIRHFGDSIYVSTQLKAIKTGKITFQKAYQGRFSNLVKLQIDVVNDVAETLNENVDRTKLEMFSAKRGNNPEALDLYKRGRYSQTKRTKVAMNEALYYFKKALAIAPDFALAYSGISDNYIIQIDNDILPYDSGVTAARQAITQAFLLDSTLGEVRTSKAIFLITLEGSRTEGVFELQKAISLIPQYAPAHQFYAVELAADAKFNTAISEIDKAKDLDPYSERIWVLKGFILFLSGRYSEANEFMDEMKNWFQSESNEYYVFKTKALYQLGKKDSALYFAKNIQGVYDYSFWKALISNNKSELEKDFAFKGASANQGLAFGNEEMAKYYTYLKDNKSACDFIEKAYQAKQYSWLKFLSVDPTWQPLRNEPRFKRVLLHLGF